MGDRFHGWKIVALAALLQPLGQGLAAAYQILVTPLMNEFGASQTQMGIGMTLLVLSGGIAGAAVGPAVDRGPIRAIMTAGVCGMALGAAILSQATALWHLAFGACVLAGSTALYGQVPINVLLVNWFVRRRGLAVAVGAMGVSVGAGAMPLATNALVDAFGWRSAVLLLAAVAFVTLLPLMRWVVRRPEDIGQWPDGGPAPAVEVPSASAEAGVAELLRQRNFWLISLGFGLTISVALAAGVFLVPHIESLGISRQQAAWAPATMAFCAFFVKPPVGLLVDRLGMRSLAAVTFSLYAGSWLVLATQESYSAILVGAAMSGFGIGSLMVLLPIFLGACFDRRSIGRASGLYLPVGMPFLLIAAPLLGAIGERTGSYQPGFFLMAGVVAVAVCLLLLVRPPVVVADAPSEGGALR